ncbi:beta-glucoside-specific PTS transporter subunit IIABC [Enterococcus sp. DIV0756]|uniref:beta-glucoside-specific PTS transporter subunit IIABC n=1 Tax=Enterococcus sp. DIV0756 TaxID=2774636 RepID=UPI003F256C3C
MDYTSSAKEIIAAVGGKENILELSHCATRLRFVLKDSQIPNDQQVEKIQGVKGLSRTSGQYQIIIGTEVPKAYQAINHELGGEIHSDDSERPKEGWFNQVLGIISGAITPMIPALTGAGLLKAFLALFVNLKWMSNTSDTYVMLSFIADAAFYFMPVIVAYGAAKKFKTNQVLAMVVAATLIHPTFTTLVGEGTSLTFLGIPVTLVSYGSTIIPALLSTWLMSYVEKISEKIIPSFLKYFLKPLVVIAVTATITILALAPLGNLIGNVVAGLIEGLNAYGSWIVPTVIGGVFPLLVMTGMHWSLAPFWLGSIANTGSETLLGPGSLASNIAQGAASLVVAIKTKDPEQKSIASSAGFTALLGITEPAMFGVTIKQKSILFSVMAGGLIGGAYAGFSGLVRYSAGGAGIALLPVFIGENPMNLIHALITMLIAFVSTFIITYVWGFKPEDIPVKKAGKVTIPTPVNGEIIDLSAVNDEVFSKKMMGEGFAVIPTDGHLISPIEGKVTMVFDTKHAIGLTCENGLELLIHIGLDTINLKGDMFDALVKTGDTVKKGQPLIDFNLAGIIDAGYDPTTMVVFTSSVNEVTDFSFGKKNTADTVLSVEM